MCMCDCTQLRVHEGGGVIALLLVLLLLRL
jgi:hypothetical protein